MNTEACNYKNLSATLSFYSAPNLLHQERESHACKFSTLWKTPVDNSIPEKIGGESERNILTSPGGQIPDHKSPIRNRQEPQFPPAPALGHEKRAKEKSIRSGMLLSE